MNGFRKPSVDWPACAQCKRQTKTIPWLGVNRRAEPESGRSGRRLNSVVAANERTRPSHTHTHTHTGHTLATHTEHTLSTHTHTEHAHTLSAHSNQRTNKSPTHILTTQPNNAPAGERR